MVDPVSPAPPQLACRVRPSTVASAIQTQAEFDVRAASSAIARTPAQIGLLELPFAVRLPGIGRPAPAGWRATLPLDATLDER
jgi:hypothetical protein